MRLLVVAGFAASVAAFRGDLIAAVVARGWEVHVAAPNLSSDLATRLTLERIGVHIHDIAVQRTGTSVVADLMLLVQLGRLMRSLKPQVVLGYTIKPVIYGTMVGWLAKVPHRFALITGLGYAFSNERHGVLHRLVRRMYAISLARAEKVFFQNPDDAALFRELKLVSRVPVTVVPGSGVNTKRFFVAPQPAGALRFLMIARLLGDKGVREYARAARLLRERFAEVRFGLVGWIDENPDAIDRSELDRWVAAGDIEFLGRLDDVRPALARCAVYVLPSYREGTPRTVLEAMATGRAVITTDAPGCRETVVDGVNGFLVPVRSVGALVAAMTRFINDSTLAARMGAASRRMAEAKYDVHKVNEIMLREMGID